MVALVFKREAVLKNCPQKRLQNCPQNRILVKPQKPVTASVLENLKRYYDVHHVLRRLIGCVDA